MYTNIYVHKHIYIQIYRLYILFYYYTLVNTTAYYYYISSHGRNLAVILQFSPCRNQSGPCRSQLVHDAAARLLTGTERRHLITSSSYWSLLTGYQCCMDWHQVTSRSCSSPVLPLTNHCSSFPSQWKTKGSFQFLVLNCEIICPLRTRPPPPLIPLKPVWRPVSAPQPPNCHHDHTLILLFVCFITIYLITSYLCLVITSWIIP